ncbi:MAG TPA: LAGLIDADG family homing endonuclease [Gammaproteobacteria bacterium]|nr:LAGLIDADG family homing endonuclease [Gammaproteobacteria bacterium]
MDVKQLGIADAAYIAGLIDGEGTITLSRKHRNENRQLAITISNTERRLLDFVLDTVGAGKITGKRTTRSNHTPSFTYAIYNRQALQLLAQIHSSLRTYKADRALLILRKYLKLTPRNGKYTDALRQKREQFEDAVLHTKPGGMPCNLEVKPSQEPEG